MRTLAVAIGVIAVAFTLAASGPAWADSAAAAATETISNGPLNAQTVLYDTAGNKVDAHEGHVYFFAGRYYWYGDSYSCGFAFDQAASNFCGMKVYDSVDLVHWHPDGYALDPTGNQAMWNGMCGGSTFGCFRPKVAYNAADGDYVMWINESRGSAGAGYLVLSSPTPTGPFTLLPSGYHVRMSYDRCKAPGSFSFGDEDLFVDDDGTAYLAYTSINTNCGNNDGLANHNIAVERLDAHYTAPTGSYTVFNRPYGIEAPAVFKRAGVYYLLYSDPMCAYCSTTGTAYATTTDLREPFTNRSNLTPTRLGGQPGGVTPIAANGSVQYLFALDRWQQTNGGSWVTNQYEANYYFAPLAFGAGGTILPIPSVDSWQTRVQDAAAPAAATFIGTSSSNGYIALPHPLRIVDTRSGLGGVRGPLQPRHGPFGFRATGVPAGASLMLNVTAVNAAGAGNVAVWGNGAQPAASTVNYYVARRTAPNAATVQLGSDGTLHAAAQGAATQLLIDVQGYYAPQSAFVPLTPARRILDTRQSATPIPAGGTRDVSLLAGNAVPQTATGVTANLTVVSSAGGNLQAYDPSQPSTGESVRAVFGSGATANLAMLPMPANGVIRFVNTSGRPVQLIIDVQGYDTGHAVTLLANPQRLESAGSPQVGYYSDLFQPQLAYQFDARNAGVPGTATAVIVEFTASPSTSGNVTAEADLDDVPGTSNLNFSPGIYQSNLAVIPLNGGMFDTYMIATNAVNMSIDVVGYAG